MPLFHHKSDEEKQREEEEKRLREEQQSAAQQSLESLEAGGIPLQAQRRLDDLRQREGSFFTSDLSVNEFILARQAGLQPLSQVMGSSVYHVGWQWMPSGNYFAASAELKVISDALNHARALALGRLQEEARRVGAHAVIGVHVTHAEYDWAGDLIEFSTLGTAVRFGDAPPVQNPALTNLSGQDFWALHQSGHQAVGVVGASTVYYVVASWRTRMASSFWGGRFNQELQDFTVGLQRARHIAMGYVWRQAHTLGADGIVGMELEQEVEEREVDLGNDQERTDMIFTFHAMGTAITETETSNESLPIYAVVPLTT